MAYGGEFAASAGLAILTRAFTLYLFLLRVLAYLKAPSAHIAFHSWFM